MLAHHRGQIIDASGSLDPIEGSRQALATSNPLHDF
jgi:hypothetical protein